MFKKVWNPILKQVNRGKSGFFEGWYFKEVSGAGDVVVSFIPGYSTVEEDKHAFIQYILVKNGEIKSGYLRYPLSDFKYSESPFRIEIDKNIFSIDGFSIDIEDSDFTIKGNVGFGSFLNIRQSIYVPNIMGPFAYIPNMECNHGVISLGHDLNGTLSIAGDIVLFEGGRGYLEKDWGRSFPKKYIWLQCNSFKSGNSLFLSIADIPFLGFEFSGFIGIFHDGVKEYRFGSYHGGGYRVVSLCDNVLEVELWRGQFRLFVKVTTIGADKLIAPVAGSMSLVIKEAVSAIVEYSFINKRTGEVIEEKGSPGSFEVVGYV